MFRAWNPCHFCHIECLSAGATLHHGLSPYPDGAIPSSVRSFPVHQDHRYRKHWQLRSRLSARSMLLLPIISVYQFLRLQKNLSQCMCLRMGRRLPAGSSRSRRQNIPLRYRGTSPWTLRIIELQVFYYERWQASASVIAESHLPS